MLLNPLTRPINRIGLLVLVAGALVSVLGIIQVSNGDNWGNMAGNTWLKSLFLQYDDRSEYWGVPVGMFLMITGAMLSYLYDATLKRLYEWIKG